MTGKKGKTRKEGRRGKFKERWTVEERRVLWECFVRSGGKRSGGYIKRLKEMWDGRDLSVRGVPSLLSQLKQIEVNNLLTLMERGEIEKRVRCEREVEDVKESESELSEVHSDGEEGMGMGDEEQLVGRRVEVRTEGVRVNVKRVDVWKKGEEVRALTGEESEVLERLREVVRSDEIFEVPSMKSVDRKKVMSEVDLVEGVMHNLVSEGMSVTDVNRLLNAGSYIVA